MSFLYWIISVLFTSFWASYYKKAINNSKLPKTLFFLIWPIVGFLILFILLVFKNNNFTIYSEPIIIFLALLIVLMHISADFIEIHILKNTKLSELLPYSNLDKLFIILFWFFIFYWTKNWTSVTTLWIALLTLIIISLWNLNFKNIQLPKNILLYFIVMWFRALNIIIVGIILVKYSTIEYLWLNIPLIFLFYLLLNYIYKNSFSLFKKETFLFYKYRFLSLILWWIWIIISLFLVETSWVIIATLIWFLSVAINILTMKVVLKDKPNIKQVILSILVVILIWIWYYFK